MNPLDVIRRTDPRRQREVEEASSSHSTDFLLLSAQSPFRVRMAKRLIPTFNRVLVEKILPPSKTNSGILLPETITKVTNCSLSLCSFFYDFVGKVSSLNIWSCNLFVVFIFLESENGFECNVTFAFWALFWFSILSGQQACLPSPDRFLSLPFVHLSSVIVMLLFSLDKMLKVFSPWAFECHLICLLFCYSGIFSIWEIFFFVSFWIKLESIGDISGHLSWLNPSFFPTFLGVGVEFLGFHFLW